MASRAELGKYPMGLDIKKDPQLLKVFKLSTT